MKKFFLILGLAGANLALASEALLLRSDAIITKNIGGKLVEIPSKPVTLDDYILAVSRLPEVIKESDIFEDLSDSALRRHGGWGYYLAHLLNEERNKLKLKDTAGKKRNTKRVQSRIALNQLLRPIQNGLQYRGFENVAVVEYLLNTLINNHTYSYQEMVKMDENDKKTTLDEIILRYVYSLDELEVPVELG